MEDVVVQLQFMIVNLQALRIDLESSDEQKWEVVHVRHPLEMINYQIFTLGEVLLRSNVNSVNEALDVG